MGRQRRVMPQRQLFMARGCRMGRRSKSGMPRVAKARVKGRKETMALRENANGAKWVSVGTTDKSRSQARAAKVIKQIVNGVIRGMSARDARTGRNGERVM